jgi:hypothetical protein
LPGVPGLARQRVSVAFAVMIFIALVIAVWGWL